MAKKKNNSAADERKARGRFMDQPGQWIDKTPASVKKRRAKALSDLAESMKKSKKK